MFFRGSMTVVGADEDSGVEMSQINAENGKKYIENIASIFNLCE